MGGSFLSGFVVVGAGEVPVVVGGEQAQDDDDGGAEEHGGVAAERAPAQRADQRADDRRAGVEVPHEDIRLLSFAVQLFNRVQLSR